MRPLHQTDAVRLRPAKYEFKQTGFYWHWLTLSRPLGRQPKDRRRKSRNRQYDPPFRAPIWHPSTSGRPFVKILRKVLSISPRRGLIRSSPPETTGDVGYRVSRGALQNRRVLSTLPCSPAAKSHRPGIASSHSLCVCPKQKSLLAMADGRFHIIVGLRHFPLERALKSATARSSHCLGMYVGGRQ
jgi:hypothetical protein